MSQNIIDDTLIIGTGTIFDNLISVSGNTTTVFNNNNRDIDFQIKSTGNSSSLYYDASTGRLGVGITGAPDAMLHVRAPCAQDGLILESITNCPTGVQLLLFHNKGIAPTGGDYPAVINLAGRNTGATVTKYAQIRSKILDSESLKTSGELIFSVDNTGSLQEVFSVNLSKLVLGGLNTIPSGTSDHTIIGQSNYSSGLHYVLIGNNNSGLQLNNSFLLGDNNIYRGPEIFSLSNNSSITGVRLFVAGLDNTVVGNSGFICGLDGQINGSYNLLIVDNSVVNSTGMLAIIRNGSIIGNSGIILGSDIVSSGNLNINFGNNNVLYGNRVTAIGSDISSEGNLNTILGNVVLVSGNNIISLGSNQSITGITNGILVGNNINLSNTTNILYLGFNNQTDDSLNNSVVLGGNNTLNAGALSDIILLGQKNITQDIINAVLIGNNNLASGDLKNNIIVGSGNAINNNSYNSICIGLLTNQTGIYVDSDGGVVGTSKIIDNNTNINSVIVGVQNQSYRNLSNAIIGNKNITSGSYVNSLGSFNDIKNVSKVYVLGNSNTIEGSNLSVIGSNSSVLAKDSIVISNKGSSNIHGSGIISIGNNQHVSSGNIIVGYNNIPGVSGLIYGTNNTEGIGGQLFRYTSGSSQITINTVPGPYQVNDKILVHIRNPILENSVILSTITNTGTDGINSSVVLTLDTLLPWSNRYLLVNNTFDDNNAASTEGSGVVTLYSRGTNQIYYGSNNIILGKNNNIMLNNNIIIGSNSVSSGINSVIIGSNITGLTDNTLSIGTSNNNKVVISDASIVLNTGTTQQSLIIRANDGSIAQTHDLLNKRLGINNTAPRSDLDVSGTITMQNLRMGLSANSGYVMTANSGGFGLWELPVRISGNDNGLLFNYPNSDNKLASSSQDIKVSRSSNIDSLNLYNDEYNNLILSSTGIVLNHNRGASVSVGKLIVWGDGGQTYSEKAFEVDPTTNLVSMYSLSTVSGYAEQLRVSGHIQVPSGLTGTILSVDNNGSLRSKTFDPHSVLFTDLNGSATGYRSFRWFNDLGILTLGGTNVNNNEFNPATYNIILSSTGSYDTIFNNLGRSGNFSVLRSGDQGRIAGSGFHIMNSNGKVGVNLPMDDMLTNSNWNQTDVSLCVNGKTVTDTIKITSFGTQGHYVRVGTNGNLTATAATFDATFTGIHPITVVSNLDGTINFGISTYDNHDNGSLLGSNQLGVRDLGRTLSFNGVRWVISSGLNIYRGLTSSYLGSTPRQARGLLFGYDGSLFDNDGLTEDKLGAISHYSNVFAGGGFNGFGAYSSSPDPGTKLGTTQFAQYFLRTRTNGNTKLNMTMDWNSETPTSTNINNVIVFPHNAYGVWTYTAYVNAMYSGIGGNEVNGVGYIIQGSVGRFNTNINSAVSLGYTINSWSGDITSVRTNVTPKVEGINSRWVLNFEVSGAAGYATLWSATVNINQTHWPMSTSFTSTVI